MAGRSLCIAFFLLVAKTAFAQEFWIMPDKFKYNVGDTVHVAFMVGDNLRGQTWNLRKDRINKLELVHNGKSEDISGLVREGKSNHLMIPIIEEGTYTVLMESNSSFIELDAKRFNDYLKEHALDLAFNTRKKANALDKPGRERYARNAKVTFQVGDKVDQNFDEAVSLTLDVKSVTNPVTFSNGDAPTFKVVFKGKPLFGARAFVYNNLDIRTYSQPVYTKQDGTIETHLFNPGLWMVSVVTMVPSEDESADWQSYWSTFLFEIKP